MSSPSRVDHLRNVCSVPPDQRTEDEIGELYDFVREVPFLAKLREPQLRGLCRAMALEVYEQGASLVAFGEDSDKYYVVLTGKVTVSTPVKGAPCPKGQHLSDECTCPNRPFESSSLEAGGGFGEASLQAAQPSGAGLRAAVQTEVLVTRRADYEEVAWQLDRQSMEQRLRFLRQCPCVRDALADGRVSMQDVLTMARCAAEADFRDEDAVCQQGSPVDGVIFIRHGRLLALRAVDPAGGVGAGAGGGGGGGGRENSANFSARSMPQDGPPADERGEALSWRQQRPSPLADPDAPPAPRRRRLLLRAGTLGPYQCYGYRQVIKDEASAVSLVGDPEAECYVISASDVQRRLPKKLLTSIFGSDMEQAWPPNDAQLLRMHYQTRRWESYKQAVVAEAVADGRRREGMRTRDAGGSTRFRRVGAAALTRRDQECFSDVSARFLRQFSAMRKDPVILQDPSFNKMLSRSGARRGQSSPRDDDSDSDSFPFEHLWSRVGNEALGLDLDDAAEADEAATRVTAVPQSARPSRAARVAGGTVRRGGGGEAPAEHQTLQLPLGAERGVGAMQRKLSQDVHGHRGLSRVSVTPRSMRTPMSARA